MNTDGTDNVNTNDTDDINQLSMIHIRLPYYKFLAILDVDAFGEPTPGEPTPGEPTPSSSVANEGFAPLCGAAATPVAALKTPVASRGEGS